MHLPNELIWALFLLLDMCAVVAVYRWFGRVGLYGYLVFALLTCNIEVLKQVEMFGLQVTLGNILYGSIFLTTDILTELHGKRAAQRAVWLGFVMMLLMTVLMQLALAMRPAPQDFAHPHLAALFGFLPRIAVGSLSAYLLSQLLDVWLFTKIRRATEGRWLWLRNNGSTLTSQALDTALFTLIALAPLPVLGTVPGFESWATVWEIGWTTYLLKLIVSAADTPFIYWARRIGRRHHTAEQYDWSRDQAAAATA